MCFYQKNLMVSPEGINHQPQAFEEEPHLLKSFLQFSSFSKRHIYEGLNIMCQLAIVHNKEYFKLTNKRTMIVCKTFIQMKS